MELPRHAYARVYGNPPNVAGIYKDRQRAKIWADGTQDKIIAVPYREYLSQELHLMLMHVRGYDWGALHEAGVVDGAGEHVNARRVEMLGLRRPSGGLNTVAEALRNIGK